LYGLALVGQSITAIKLVAALDDVSLYHANLLYICWLSLNECSFGISW